MTKPDHCLYLSYTKVNGAGQSASPSSLVEEIKRLFPKLSMMESLEARDRNRITAPKDGLDYLMDDLHHFDSLDKDKRELYAWYYRSSQYGQWLKKLSENVLGFQKTDSLSKAVARGLYGKVLENSVTRLEKYAACAYSHFLNYGLFLKERDMFSLEARDLGTIFHDCLEQFSRELYKRDYSWFQLPEEEAEELAEEADAAEQIWLHYLDNAVLELDNEHRLHDELESYYIAAMDFEALDAVCKDIFGKIWQLAAERS